MVIDDANRKRILSVFKAIHEAKEQSKSFNQSAGDMRSELAKSLDVKPKVVSSAYNEWLRRRNEPEVMNSSDEIVEALQEA